MSKQITTNIIEQKGVVVVDYGSQYTLLIVRKLRELGVYSEIIGCQAKFPTNFQAQAVILSGGPESVFEQGAKKLPIWLFDKAIPILGICYGMQLLVQYFGGKVEAGDNSEYGKESLVLEKTGSKLLAQLSNNPIVWMSHGDHVESLSNNLITLAKSSNGTIAAIQHSNKSIFGLQFHPEVKHSECGQQILSNFLFKCANVEKNWKNKDILKIVTSDIKEQIGNGHALVACSGGVDSTVTAALLVEALGAENVTAVFCDHGLLRKNEAIEVLAILNKIGLKNIIKLDCQEIFINALKNIDDPERKRIIIGKLFIDQFEDYAKSKEIFTHLAQGTLYPDVIESAGHGDGSKVIKSHHNVGGLPEKLHLKLSEPLRFLFKDEIRLLGKELNIQQDFLKRHPFPGPGLAIRILGAVTDERIEMVRESDYIFISALHEQKLYHKVWQAFTVLLPVKSVGVMGDNRTYEMTIALRAVGSEDAMTADVSNLSIEFLSLVANRIVRQVKGINRVVYDITTKPPATIEWE